MTNAELEELLDFRFEMGAEMAPWNKTRYDELADKWWAYKRNKSAVRSSIPRSHRAEGVNFVD